MAPSQSQSKMVAQREELSLNDAASHLLEECRTVVPGMQALFGFQLIVVFSASFREVVTPTERLLHLAAIVLVAISIVLVMSPAVLHREAEPLAVSRRFLTLSSHLLMASMAPLAAGFCLDLYVVSRVLAGSTVAGVVTVVLFGVFLAFWYVVPRVFRQTRTGGSEDRAARPGGER